MFFQLDKELFNRFKLPENTLCDQKYLKMHLNKEASFLKTGPDYI